MRSASCALAPLALAGALTACSVPREAGFPDVARIAKARTGHEVRWRQGSAEAAAIDRAVQRLLSKELTAESAVQVALLNNRRLQATYEELGIAQADVVQAGLIENPSFEAAVEFPVDGEPPGFSFGVSQDFLSLLFLSARQRLAEAELERVKLEVGDAVIALAAEARAAFFELQAAMHAAAMQRLIAEAAQASLDLATRQRDAGNLSDLDFAMQRAEYEAAKLELARSEAAVRVERERLARLLGLWGSAVDFRVAPRLPDLPAREPPMEHVERLAMLQRLDVAAARKQTEVLERALALARAGRWIGALELGVGAEREPHDTWRVGPHAGVTLPIFDQGQAAIAKIDAERRRAEHALAALAIDVRSEVRVARDRLLTARGVAEHYKVVVIPLHEQLVALSQQQYDAMLIGVYQVLAAKQRETETYRAYIEAVRDYWIARTELERAAGGRLEEVKR